MKRSVLSLPLALLMSLAPITGFAYSPGEEVPISYPAEILKYDSASVRYSKTGGQVFVSNAPESIYDDGAQRADGSIITGQVNSTLYRDTVLGSFRLWASHYNKSSQTLKFWLHVENRSEQDISLYKTMQGYSDTSVTTAASRATVQFMDSVPESALIAMIPAGQSVYFAYSDEDNVRPGNAMIYIAEFRAEFADRSDAEVRVSNVVTNDQVTDPTPYATTGTIARTNATATTSDDYRGLLAHWGREGTIDVTLTDENPAIGIKVADLGYAGEQESLMARWDVHGNPVEQREVRFIIPGQLNKLRLAYWYTDYQIGIRITNRSSFPVAHTLYGSNGSNPGFINYQINGSRTVNTHFSRNTAVPIHTENDFELRTMVMPSAYLPFGLYIAAGNQKEVPLDLAVVKAEHTLFPADVATATKLINTHVPESERAPLLDRLSAVVQAQEASERVERLERETREAEQLLLVSDFSVKGKQRTELLQTLQQSVQAADENSKEVKELLSAIHTEQPVLASRKQSWMDALNGMQGRLRSMSQLIEDAGDPPLKGNGKADIRMKLGTGSVISLLSEQEEKIVDALGSLDRISWLSHDRSIAEVTQDGHVRTLRNGVVKLTGFNDKGVVHIYLILSGNER
ncbi:hypothetical protein PV433_31815 [Paenibacillus sp. GYB004]|uniref:hypothetical protein n=1 Tax=Paenibacillus sp. GYB004 TaxID=2994393 RepID=UPI002F96A936